jgi:cytochrome c oxidase subunit 3
MSEQLEFDTTGKPHPYHIVRPSIWPLVASFAALLLAVGAVFYMHEVKIGAFGLGWPGLILGFLSVAAVMFFWWKDIIFEAVHEKIHTPIAQLGLRYGMMLFIASEVMFFVAFFWAFFDASLYADQENMVGRLEYTGGQWPPPQIEVINALDLPLLMTMILLLSGCTVTWAHHAIVEGHQEDFTLALGLTVLLGVFFLGFQVFEYAHATFGFTEGIYPSVFYMATGFHGFHVFVGTVFLFVCWLRAKKRHFTKDSHFGFEAAAWYWHFVDVVWLFLFVAIYWWGSLGAEAAAH